jgi:hypothetical protein
MDGTNAKLALQFRSRPWRGSGPWGISTGQIITDLAFQNTWEVSRSQPGSEGILVDYTGATPARRWTTRARQASRPRRTAFSPSSSASSPGSATSGPGAPRSPRRRSSRSGSAPTPATSSVSTPGSPASRARLSARAISPASTPRPTSRVHGGRRRRGHPRREGDPARTPSREDVAANTATYV